MTKQHLALILIVLIPGLFYYCDPNNEMEVIVFSSQNAPFYEVEQESEADAVLLLSVKLPEEEHSQSFYIKRNPRPKPYGIGSAFGHGFASCGVTSDGKGVGLGGSVSLDISNAGVSLVTMSFYWTSAKGNKGKLEGDIEVPWLGESNKELGQGAQAHLSFRAPKK